MNVSIPTLADSAMLCYLRVAVWSARKLDKKQTAKVTEDAGATTDAARVSKHLLANADSLLKDVQRKASELRDYLDSNTLPWNDAGQRILSNDKALTFVGPFENKKKEFDELAQAAASPDRAPDRRARARGGGCRQGGCDRRHVWIHRAGSAQRVRRAHGVDH